MRNWMWNVDVWIRIRRYFYGSGFTALYNGISVDKILRHFNLISLNLFQGSKLSWRPPRRKLRSLRRKQLRFFVQVHELLIKNFLCLVCIGFSTFYRSWFIPSYFTQKFSEKISVTDLGSRIWCFFYPWILFRFFWSWIWYSWYGKNILDLPQKQNVMVISSVKYPWALCRIWIFPSRIPNPGLAFFQPGTGSVTPNWQIIFNQNKKDDGMFIPELDVFFHWSKIQKKASRIPDHGYGSDTLKLRNSR